MVSVERIELPPHVPKTRTLPLRHTEKKQQDTLSFFHKKWKLSFAESILKLAPQGGIEPPTGWLTVSCNYRCATVEYILKVPILNPSSLTTVGHILICHLLWRSQGVTIPFFMRDRHTCVHEHFETRIYRNTLLINLTARQCVFIKCWLRFSFRPNLSLQPCRHIYLFCCVVHHISSWVSYAL